MAGKVSVRRAVWRKDAWRWEERDGIYRLLEDASIALVLSDGDFLFSFDAGFRCDGLSVPKAFRWFLPSWDKANMLYNLAGAVHDALYGNRGFGIFDRDDSDAIFRGLLREAGIDRFHASTADFVLGLSAKSHWGNDDLQSAHLAHCVPA